MKIKINPNKRSWLDKQVERSQEGKIFESIGMLQGSLFSATRKDYEFNDTHTFWVRRIITRQRNLIVNNTLFQDRFMKQ